MCKLLRPTIPCPDISAVRSRRPAASEFAQSLLRSPGGISAPAGHSARGTRADLECRCITSHAAGESRRSAGESPRHRSLRDERCRSDGEASTLPSGRARTCSIPGLICMRDVHASLELCRSPLPLASDLDKSSDMMGARLTTRARRAHRISSRHWSRTGMGLVCARKILAKSVLLGPNVSENVRLDART